MDTITQFWKWFQDNNKAYLFLDDIDEDVKENLLNDFEEQLHKYCDQIYFEIGGDPNEDQELIITAEGDEKYFSQVEDLVKAAPQISGWTFIAFKPSISGHFKSEWDDLELNTEDMWFLPLLNKKNNDLGIRVCLKNYDLIKDNEILTTLLYKMLDTILGEKSFALNIKYVTRHCNLTTQRKKECIQSWNYQNSLRDINPKRHRAAGNICIYASLTEVLTMSSGTSFSSCTGLKKLY